jgi:hypothetical protein
MDSGLLFHLTSIVYTNGQVAILGFVTFCSVGMFSALGGLGAG